MLYLSYHEDTLWLKVLKQFWAVYKQIHFNASGRAYRQLSSYFGFVSSNSVMILGSWNCDLCSHQAYYFAGNSKRNLPASSVPPTEQSTKSDTSIKSDATDSSVLSKTEEELVASSKLRRFSFTDLKLATRNFRPDSLLGEGGFGCVFKGWVDEHGTAPVKPGTGLTVAVKTLNHNGLQGHKEWLVSVKPLYARACLRMCVIRYWFKDTYIDVYTCMQYLVHAYSNVAQTEGLTKVTWEEQCSFRELENFQIYGYLCESSWAFIHASLYVCICYMSNMYACLVYLHVSLYVHALISIIVNAFLYPNINLYT